MAIKDNFKKGSVELLVLAVLSKADLSGSRLPQKIKE